MIIRRTSELKFPDEYMKRIGHADGEIRPKEGRWMYTGGEVYKRLRGRAARRRDRAISHTLHQVHTNPNSQRSTEDTVSDDGTILFDLT